jgi:hypothetical protein
VFSQTGVFSNRCFLKPVFCVIRGGGRFVSLVSALFLILLAGCGRKPANEPNAVFSLSKRPDIRFPAIFFDPSEIKANAYKIDILNDGDDAVEFEDVRKSCACALMDVPVGLLRPGETTSVALEVAGEKVVGSRALSLLFIFKGREPVRCKVFTEAYPVYEVQDGDRKFLGQIQSNSTAMLEFEINTFAATEKDLLLVQSVSGASDNVAIDLKKEAGDKTSDSKVLTASTKVNISVTPTLSHGDHLETIDFVLCSATGMTKKVPVHLSWFETGILTVTPPRIFVNQETDRSSATLAEIERTLAIRTIDSRSFRIESLDCQSGAIRADFDKTRQPEQRITIWIDPSRVERLLWKSIEIKLSDGLGVIRVPLGVYFPNGEKQ